MGRRRSQDSPLVAALRAATGDLTTARYLADLAPGADADAVIADPRAWIATARIEMWPMCGAHAADRTAPGDFAQHRIVLDTDGLHLLDHPGVADLTTEALFTALGSTTPTCVLLASATVTAGVLNTTHAAAVTKIARSQFEPLRYLVAARAFLAADPDTDLPALRQILTQGLTPADWQPWANAGFTPALAAPFLTRQVPLAAAAAWLSAGLGTGRGATLAALGATPDEVTALIPVLGKKAAHDWVQHTRTPVLPAEDRLALHAAAFTPQTAGHATREVGLDGALAFASVGLATLSSGHRFTEYWWQVLPEHPHAAAEWDALGVSSGYAAHLLDKRALAFEDIDEWAWPDTLGDWIRAGVRSIDELSPLAALTYCPQEWPEGTPRIICPDGLPLEWEHAIWLARTAENPPAWIAAATGAPEWAHRWAGPRCLVPTCTEPGCTRPVGPGHGNDPDGTPVIATYLDDTHPLFDEDRNRLITLICEAAADGFPEEALPAMGRYAHHGARAWAYVAEIAHLFTDADDATGFLTSRHANPYGAPSRAAADYHAWAAHRAAFAA